MPRVFPRPPAAIPVLAALALLTAAPTAPAVILRLVSLKDVLNDVQVIFVASVDKVDPDRPAVVFKFEEKLKGDAPPDRLPVNLAGDAEAKKGGHAKVMLDRLEPGRKLVVFADKLEKGKKCTAFVFLEGTWFQIQGTPDDDGKAVRWAFLHCEPYLRRTFKGTTAELKQVVADALAGKAAPPAPNEKEPPGYGPGVKKCGGEEGVSRDPESAEGSAGVFSPPAAGEGGPGSAGPGGGMRLTAFRGASPGGESTPHPVRRASPPSPARGEGQHSHPSPLAGEGRPGSAGRGEGTSSCVSDVPSPGSQSLTALSRKGRGEKDLSPSHIGKGAGGLGSSPLFAVIPSFVLVGPLAVVMALFPGVGARLAVQMTRWRAFLVVASANSTLALIYSFAHAYLPDNWASSETAFTVWLLCGTAVGLVWAGRRYRRMAAADPAVTAAPTRHELLALLGATAMVGALVATVRFFGPWRMAVEIPMREFTFVGVGLLAATLYAGYRSLTRGDDRGPDGATPPTALRLSGESVGLGAMFLCGLVAAFAMNLGGQAVTLGTESADDAPPAGPTLADVRAFEFPDAHQVMSSVTVSGNRLYFGAARQTGFKVRGHVFAADADSGKVVWRFDADDEMKPVFATPAVADGAVYAGEGLHTDSGCKLFCLDAATGKPAWGKPFETTSHTEGSPLVVGGRAYFSAGDDGLYCVDAKTGAEVWHVAGQDRGLHIDTPPVVSGSRVFAGSGYYTNALLCFDAATGGEVWRVPTPLRSFGPPLVIGPRVVFGLGTGNLTLDTEGDEKEPAGAVVCVDADSGREAWRLDLSRSVHTQLAADAFSVYATCRDGCVYALDRKTGKVRWKTGIGGAVLGGPAVAAAGGVPVAVYAVSREGTVACLNPHTGRVVWRRPLPGFEWDGQEANGVFGTPAVVASGSRRAVYVGAMRLAKNTGKKTCAVFRFDDQIGE